MSRALLLDLGGSSLKAGLYDLDGRPLATERIPNVFVEDEIGKAEQDPQDWWQALQIVADRLAKQALGGLSGVEAVAICGFTRTQVFLNRKGEPVRPAITFRDSRSQGLVQDVLSRPQVQGHPLARHLNSFHPLARLLWLKHNEDAAWRATHRVVDPKDYLNFKLTGELACDPVSQFWLINAMEGGAASLAALTGIDKGVLPNFRRPHEVVGTVAAGLPGALSQIAGAPVFCGANDTWTAVAGIGALKLGRGYCISGSSEVFGILSNLGPEAEGLITIPWGDSIWQLGGPGQNGANVLAWMVDCFAPDERPFDVKLAGLLSQQANRPLLFHPYLYGERTPLWDRDIRACFMGVIAAHKPGDLVRGAMEGISFVNRMVLERAEAAVQHRADEIRLAGGGSRNAYWNQIRADILKRPVMVSNTREMGLLGCLAVARLGLSLSASIADAADGISDDFVRYEPRRASSSAYDDLYILFQETHRTVEHASHRLAELSRNNPTLHNEKEN